MVMLTVPDLPDEIYRALRVRAARHGLSIAAEARAILAGAVGTEPSVSGRTTCADREAAAVSQAKVTALPPPEYQRPFR